MIKQCLLGLTAATLPIDVWGWQYITVSLMAQGRGTPVLGLGEFTFTTIIQETGAYMQYALVWKHRFIWILLVFYFFLAIKLWQTIILQVLSQCNIYESGEKKAVFKYMPEKVPLSHYHYSDAVFKLTQIIELFSGVHYNYFLLPLCRFFFDFWFEVFWKTNFWQFC